MDKEENATSFKFKTVFLVRGTLLLSLKWLGLDMKPKRACQQTIPLFKEVVHAIPRQTLRLSQCLTHLILVAFR